MDKVAVKNFNCGFSDLEMKKEHVCVIGPPSVGKSTLMNEIFGLRL